MSRELDRIKYYRKYQPCSASAKMAAIIVVNKIDLLDDLLKDGQSEMKTKKRCWQSLMKKSVLWWRLLKAKIFLLSTR